MKKNLHKILKPFVIFMALSLFFSSCTPTSGSPNNNNSGTENTGGGNGGSGGTGSGEQGGGTGGGDSGNENPPTVNYEDYEITNLKATYEETDGQGTITVTWTAPKSSDVKYYGFYSNGETTYLDRNTCQYKIENPEKNKKISFMVISLDSNKDPFTRKSSSISIFVSGSIYTVIYPFLDEVTADRTSITNYQENRNITLTYKGYNFDKLSSDEYKDYVFKTTITPRAENVFSEKIDYYFTWDQTEFTPNIIDSNTAELTFEIPLLTKEDLPKGYNSTDLDEVIFTCLTTLGTEENKQEFKKYVYSMPFEISHTSNQTGRTPYKFDKTIPDQVFRSVNAFYKGSIKNFEGKVTVEVYKDDEVVKTYDEVNPDYTTSIAIDVPIDDLDSGTYKIVTSFDENNLGIITKYEDEIALYDEVEITEVINKVINCATNSEIYLYLKGNNLLNPSFSEKTNKDKLELVCETDDVWLKYFDKTPSDVSIISSGEAVKVSLKTSENPGDYNCSLKYKGDVIADFTVSSKTYPAVSGGAILFSDGTFVKYSEYTEEHKTKTASGIVFGFSHGIPLVATVSEVYSDDLKFTSKDMTQFDLSKIEGEFYLPCDETGLDNWEELCKADPDASTNMSDYPAYEALFKANLIQIPGCTNWYIPSAFEMDGLDTYNYYYGYVAIHPEKKNSPSGYHFPGFDTDDEYWTSSYHKQYDDFFKTRRTSVLGNTDAKTKWPHCYVLALCRMNPITEN